MKSMQDFATGRLTPFVCTYVSIIDLFIALGAGGHSLIWLIRGCAAGQDMVFGLFVLNRFN